MGAVSKNGIAVQTTYVLLTETVEDLSAEKREKRPRGSRFEHSQDRDILQLGKKLYNRAHWQFTKHCVASPVGKSYLTDQRGLEAIQHELADLRDAFTDYRLLAAGRGLVVNQAPTLFYSTPLSSFGVSLHRRIAQLVGDNLEGLKKILTTEEATESSYTHARRLYLNLTRLLQGDTKRAVELAIRYYEIGRRTMIGYLREGLSVEEAVQRIDVEPIDHAIQTMAQVQDALSESATQSA